MKEVVKNFIWQGLGRGYDSNAFVIKGDQSNILVDSGTHMAAQEVKQIIDGFSIDQVVLTHGHLDHVGGIAHALKQIKVEVWTSPLEADRIETIDESYIDPFFGSNIPQVPVSRRIKEGDVVSLGNVIFEVLETPGHTSGSICLYERSHNWLFSGDTVFADGSFGRTDLKTGSSPQLIQSLKRLSMLPVSALFPGHMRTILSEGSAHITESYQIASRYLR